MQGFAVVGCFAAVLILTPLAARLSWKLGAVDVPRDWRRMHTDTVPRAGGMAVFAAVAAAMLASGPLTRETATALAGGAAVFCIGLADDILPLPPLARLTVQTLAATVGAAGAGVAAAASRPTLRRCAARRLSLQALAVARMIHAFSCAGLSKV